MRKTYTGLFFSCFASLMFSGALLGQVQDPTVGLPRGLTTYERSILPTYKFSEEGVLPSFVETDPPTFPVRTMAEWEEIQTLVISWTDYTDVLAEIVKHAQKETEVLIVTQNENSVKSTLSGKGISLDNVSFVQAKANSIWMRDYGANTIYKNDVEDLLLVDWIYNRPRPDDDKVPIAVAQKKNLTLYATTTGKTDMVNTGGNFMADGLGTAFASELILEENRQGNPYGVSVKSEQQIDKIMKDFMGIDRYIKMDVLPYDGIHHIDMHMKLLDEETLLVGKYPNGVADGPQIEANIQYVLNGFKSIWGDPYRIVRIPMPPDNGNYPDKRGAYKTYSNMTFVNGTILVPIYNDKYQEDALDILRENLPGYKIIGINSNNIIKASGAIHCITRAVGSNDPLLIAHQRLRDNTKVVGNGFEVEALIKHKSGIKSANVFYTDDLGNSFKSVEMKLASNDQWIGSIPNMSTTGTIYYYISAEANSGKKQVRPIVAPEGYWQFKTDVVGIEETNLSNNFIFENAFPNPAGAITCIPLKFNKSGFGSIKLFDVMGREATSIYEGEFVIGEQKYFFNAAKFSKGVYNLVVNYEGKIKNQKVIIK